MPQAESFSRRLPLLEVRGSRDELFIHDCPSTFIETNEVTYGENHRILRTDQLPEKGQQVDPPGRKWQSTPFRPGRKEIGLIRAIWMWLRYGFIPSWEAEERWNEAEPASGE